MFKRILQQRFTLPKQQDLCVHPFMYSYDFLHTHDYYELMFVTHGELLHQWNGSISVLQKGMLVLIRPNEIHSLSKSGITEPRLVNFLISCDLMKIIKSYLNSDEWNQRLEDPSNQLSLCIPECSCDELNERITARMLEPSYGINSYHIGFKPILMDLLSMFVTENKADDIPDWFHSLLNTLEKKEIFTKGFPVIKQICNVSPTHVARMFNKHLNTTPTEYLLAKRLDYARFLLSTTQLELIDVSQECGFENLSYFYRTFKNRFSFSPGSFRKQLGEP